MTTQFLRTPLLVIAALAVFTGCSTQDTGVEAHKERKNFIFAVHQIAPEPVYVRSRYVLPPEVLPSRDPVATASQKILPIYRFDLKNASLDEAARTLAATSRYSSYCASSLARQPISITSLGTIDEIAQQIAKKAGITVLVDHSNHEVRFMANSGVPPELFKGDK